MNPFRIGRVSEDSIDTERVLGFIDPRDGFSPSQFETVMRSWPKSSKNAPWLYWDSELYSLGMILRALVHWPVWLPIPVNADHGAVTMMASPPRERAAPSGIHLTFNSIKFGLAPGAPTRWRLIASPWISWLEACGLRLHSRASGTLVFLPHSLPGDSLQSDYVDEYLAWLTGLPGENGPYVICLHPHDVRNGLHRQLRDQGHRVVTAGDSSHPEFFLRWVSIAQHFRYATSPRPGSEMLLFHALGGTYFSGGPLPRYDGSTLLSDESYTTRTRLQVLLQEEVWKLERDLFAAPTRTSDQAEYLSVFTTRGPRDSISRVRRDFLQGMLRIPAVYWIRWWTHYVGVARVSMRRS